MRPHSSLGPYILILLGLFFLLSKRGWLPDVGPLLVEWWPLVLIIIGLGMLVRRSSRGEPRD